ncbi:MAG: hypothetical protein KBT59_14035, partial [Sphingomonadales bacterium]|nr:hypothetical protein [Sphingomonadales bacterium]
MESLTAICYSAAKAQRGMKMERMMTDKNEPQLDVIVVGAGFAGLYLLHKFRQMGLSARAFEAG